MKKFFSILITLCMAVGMFAEKYDSGESAFTSTSYDCTGFSFSTAQAGGTTAPVINSGNIRLYRKSSSSAGLGSTLTITPKKGYTLSSVTIYLKSNLAYSYSLNGASAQTATSTSLAVSNVTSSLVFQNKSTSQMDVKQIVVEYASSAPAYTVTAQSNNTSLGTVSGTTTITASPKACVGYASPAYTVTGGSATVAQDGNTFTVSGMTANVTVTINFAEQANDTYLDNVQGTVMDGSYCGTYSAPTIADKTVVSAANQTGDCAVDHYHFVGWVKRSITTGEKNEPADIIKAGTAITADGSTYRAVWAKEAK